MRRGYVRTLVGLMLITAAGPVAAADDTTAKVTLTTMSVGVGLGATWGEGILEYRGQSYPFTMTGFSLGEVGASRVMARGEVYNLNRVEDFPGVFMAAAVGATIGGGAGAAAMQNQNNVKMVWTATNQGLSFSLANAGLNVKLTEADGQPAAAPRPLR